MIRQWATVWGVALSLTTAESQDSLAPGTKPATNAVVHATPAPQTTNTAPYTVLGYLEQKDRIITVKSAGSAPVYSVSTRDGRVVFENLTLEQLQARSPELHEFVKTGIAGGVRPAGAVRDARINPIPIAASR